MGNKPYKDIDAQINHLKNKGVKITNYNRTKTLLNNRIYCCCITPYKATFSIEKDEHGKHIYEDLTDEDFILLNDLDNEITNIFRAACLEIESRLRVIFIEYICADSNITNFDYIHILNTITSSPSVRKLDKKYIANDIKVFEKRHLSKKDVAYSKMEYNCIPIWIYMQYQSLGSLITLLQSISHTEIFNNKNFNHKNQNKTQVKQNINFLKTLRNHIMHCGTIGTAHNAHAKISLDKSKIERAFKYIYKYTFYRISTSIKTIINLDKYNDVTVKLLYGKTLLNEFIIDYKKSSE